MIRVFSVDGIIVNADNEEEVQRLIDQEAEEIDASIFGDLGNWATSENTKKVGEVWVFSPDMDEINGHVEYGEELELDRRLSNLVGDNPEEKIAKLQSLNPSPNSIGRRYLNKRLAKISQEDSDLSEFL